MKDILEKCGVPSVVADPIAIDYAELRDRVHAALVEVDITLALDGDMDRETFIERMKLLREQMWDATRAMSALGDVVERAQSAVEGIEGPQAA